MHFHLFLVHDLFPDTPVVQSDEASRATGSVGRTDKGIVDLTYGYVHVKLGGGKLLLSENDTPRDSYTHIHVPFIATPCRQIHEHQSRPKHCRV